MPITAKRPTLISLEYFNVRDFVWAKIGIYAIL
jgi:hypothetical protein